MYILTAHNPGPSPGEEECRLTFGAKLSPADLKLPKYISSFIGLCQKRHINV